MANQYWFVRRFVLLYDYGSLIRGR